MGLSWSLEPGAEPFPGYRLLHILGRGGFAEVWAADYNGSRVALKFMHSRDPMVAANEVRAIQQMKQIRHHYLLRIDQVWSLPGYVVFSMELADGSLMDMLHVYYAEFGGPIFPEPLWTAVKPSPDSGVRASRLAEVAQADVRRARGAPLSRTSPSGRTRARP